MPELINEPVRVEAAGTLPKLIDEYAGQASTGEPGLSIAHMRSPAGWAEPGQRPEFDEYTLVLRGCWSSSRRPANCASGRARRCAPGRANGSATAPRKPTAPSTSRSACRRSARTPCTATNDGALLSLRLRGALTRLLPSSL